MIKSHLIKFSSLGNCRRCFVYCNATETHLCNIENTFTQISVTLISAHTLLIHFVTWKTCLSISMPIPPHHHHHLHLMCVWDLPSPFLLFLFTVQQRQLSASLCPSISITLNSFFIPSLCIIVMFSVHFFHFIHDFFQNHLFPFLSSSFLSLSRSFLPAVQECALKTCFNLTNKSQLAEEWRMEVEWANTKKRRRRINKMLNGVQEVVFAFLPPTFSFLSS